METEKSKQQTQEKKDGGGAETFLDLRGLSEAEARMVNTTLDDLCNRKAEDRLKVEARVYVLSILDRVSRGEGEMDYERIAPPFNAAAERCGSSLRIHGGQWCVVGSGFGVLPSSLFREGDVSEFDGESRGKGRSALYRFMNRMFPRLFPLKK